jgi:hypothetical protein
MRTFRFPRLSQLFVEAARVGQLGPRKARVYALNTPFSFHFCPLFSLEMNVRTLVGAALAVVILHAGVARAEEVSDDAKKHFVAGVNLLRDPAKPRYEEAYREFKAAYRLSPSPKILGNLALCAMMLERDSEAIETYGMYLESGVAIDPEQRQQIERDLMTLRSGLVEVTVSSAPDGAVLIDQRVPSSGEAITNVYPAINGKLTLGVRQGHHVMKARLPGRPEVTWEFDATPGASVSHTFNVPLPLAPSENKASEPTYVTERPMPRKAIVAGGVAVALGIGGGIVGTIALRKNSDYQAKNNGFSPDEASSLRSDGRTLNVATDVLLGGAIVAAAVGVYFYVTRPSYTKAVGDSSHGPAFTF